MPQLTIRKDAVRKYIDIPRDIYELKLLGFKPRWTKKRDAFDMNPQLEIVNSNKFINDNGKPVSIDGQHVFANTCWPSAVWIVESFFHAFGIKLIDVKMPDGSESWALPIGDNEDTSGAGMFTGPKDDPTKWVYSGPLLGKTFKAEVVMKALISGATSPSVNEFFCAIPGCQTRHAKNLAS